MHPVHANLRQIAETFDARAANYARNEWHRRCAERLVELCALEPGARILDAAAGTGFATLAAARRVGEAGRVLGVDLSPGMLRVADAAVQASGLLNIELLEADAVRMPQLASETFDAITCAAGLLYMPVADALREWHRLLEPGGLVAFSSMHAGSPPAGRIFRDCAAACGLALRDPSESLGTATACQAVLEEAGFRVADIVSEVVEFSAQDFALAWESNSRSAGHSEVASLSPEDRAALHTAYLDALAPEERTNPGALARADVLYAFGRS